MLVPDLNVNVFRINRTFKKDPLVQFLCFFLSQEKRLQDTCGHHLQKYLLNWCLGQGFYDLRQQWFQITSLLTRGSTGCKMSVTDNLVRASPAVIESPNKIVPQHMYYCGTFSVQHCSFWADITNQNFPLTDICMETQTLIGGCVYNTRQSHSGRHCDWCCLVAHVEGEQFSLSLFILI